MATLLAWLESLASSVLVPLIEKWISQMAVSKQVRANQVQTDALIKTVAQIQTAKTPEDFQNDIKALAAADNSGAQ
jgi:hypothetical protein